MLCRSGFAFQGLSFLSRFLAGLLSCFRDPGLPGFFSGLCARALKAKTSAATVGVELIAGQDPFASRAFVPRLRLPSRPQCIEQPGAIRAAGDIIGAKLNGVESIFKVDGVRSRRVMLPDHEHATGRLRERGENFTPDGFGVFIGGHSS